MAFKHIDDFECVWVIAKENHIAFECETSNIMSKLRPCATHRSGQAGQLKTLYTQLIGKTVPYHKIATLSHNVFEDGNQIISSRRRVNKIAHSKPIFCQ